MANTYDFEQAMQDEEEKNSPMGRLLSSGQSLVFQPIEDMEVEADPSVLATDTDLEPEAIFVPSAPEAVFVPLEEPKQEEPKQAEPTNSKLLAPLVRMGSQKDKHIIEIPANYSYDELTTILSELEAHRSDSIYALKLNSVMQKWGTWSTSKQKNVINAICRALAKNPQITSLELENNKMDAKLGSYLLDQLMAHNIKLKKLNLAGNDLGKYRVLATDVTAFLHKLGNYAFLTPSLTNLDLSHNAFKARETSQVLNEMSWARKRDPNRFMLKLNGNALAADALQSAEVMNRCYETARDFPSWLVKFDACSGIRKEAVAFLTAATGYQEAVQYRKADIDKKAMLQKARLSCSDYIQGSLEIIRSLTESDRNPNIKNCLSALGLAVLQGDVIKIKSAAENLLWQVRSQQNYSKYQETDNLLSELIAATRIYLLVDEKGKLSQQTAYREVSSPVSRPDVQVGLAAFATASR